MINSSSGNTIFVSELLKTNPEYAPVFQRLEKIVHDIIPLRTLAHSKTIWCRDYMPIQVGGKRFVQFNYDPKYLKDSKEEYPVIPELLFEANIENPKFSSIRLDGGNVISNGTKTLISSRVFEENPEYENRNELISALENLLETEVIIIPQVNSDMTGHVDGMVRFVNDTTLVGMHRAQEYKYWQKGINQVLKQHQLDYIDFPSTYNYNPKFPLSAVGCYLNFVETRQNILLFPVYEIETDRDAVRLLEQIFPTTVIEPIVMTEVALQGGVLNCVTWTPEIPEPKVIRLHKKQDEGFSDETPF